MKELPAIDPHWQWLKITVDGDDLVVDSTPATAFGGNADIMDSGETASGYNTKQHPDVIGVALPMRHDAIHDHKRDIYPLRNSPIPNMPFGLDRYGRDNPHGAHVDVTFDNGLLVSNVPVIDLGPAYWTKHGLDCTVALAKKRQPRATANNFTANVRYRILGAAKYIA